MRFIALAVIAGTLIACTIFVSPKLGPRFYYVSMALLLAGFIGVVEAVLTERQLRPLVVLAVVASAYAAYRTIPLYEKLKAQSDARLAALAATPERKVFIASPTHGHRSTRPGGPSAMTSATPRSASSSRSTSTSRASCSVRTTRRSRSG
jgi:hypothetical protein